MKVFKEIGSKERFLEVFQNVNKVKLNEAFGQGLNPQSALEMAFSALKSNTLTVKHSSSQADNNASYVELVCVDKQGNNITFTFKATTREGDQEGVFNVEDVVLEQFTFDSQREEESVELAGDTLKAFNMQHKNEMFDVVNKYMDVESEEPVDSLYEDAIKKIDSYPFGTNPERMQTSKAYGDEKPTNDAVRVNAPVLQKFAPEKMEEEVIGEPKPINPSTKSPVDDLPPEKRRIIMSAINNLTVKKGRREYAPSVAEITSEIQRMQASGEAGQYEGVSEEFGEDDVESQELQRFNSAINEPENPDAVAVEDEPVPEVSDEEKQKIYTAYENLVNGGIPEPTTMQIMDELDRMAGKVKSQQKTRSFPKEAEPFLENGNADFIRQAVTAEMEHVIRQAHINVFQRLGAEVNNLSHEEFNKLIQDEGNKILRELRIAALNEEESKEKKGDYPDPIGKKFKPKAQIKKKKKRPDTTVKLSEAEVEDDEEETEVEVPETTPEEKSGVEKENPDLYPDGWKEMDGMHMGPNAIFKPEDKPVSVPQGEMNGENDGMSLEPQGDEVAQLAQDKEETGEILVGGKGDGKSPLDFNTDQIIKGLEVEKEHTDDPMVAIEIVLDHLTEDPEYYTQKDDPEASAQAGASADAEGGEDKEMTDVLLGFKPHNVGDEVKGDEEAEEIPEPEKEEVPEETPEEEEEETEEDKERSNAINEELVKIAKMTLSKREVPTGMTKKEAVQILIKNNTRTLL